MNSAAKAALALVAIALAVVLFLLLRDGGGESTDATVSETTVEQAADGADGGSGEGGPEKPEKPERPEKPEIATIEIKGGEPVGGVKELSFEKGEEIRFVVESDVADEVHLHGYDVYVAVPAGGKAELEVPATIEGVFEAELHHALVPIAEITVNP